MADDSQKLIEMVALLLEVDPATLTHTTRRDALAQWDSLNHLNICTALGQEFGIELTAAEIESIDGIPDLLAILRHRGR